jgi:hypothetical protein
MRHLLVDGWRALWRNPALRSAFCARHLGAGATSLGIHASVIGAVVWLTAPVIGVGLGAHVGAKRMTRTFAIFAPRTSANNTAPGYERPSAKPLLQTSKESKDSGPVKAGIRMEPGESTLDFPGFTFDVAKLVGRSAALFPFLTRTFTFNVEKPRDTRAKPLVNPFATQPALSMRATPLNLSEADVQRIVDEAWARRERWGAFQRIRSLADLHDPDVGQVPALLRGHANQNALQPYVETKMRDPRVWTQLALAADHELFIDYIAEYVSRHPGTKASIELLFLLDLLVQGSFDTLQVFLEIEPDHDLKWTRRMNPAAFKAIVEIRDYYVAQRKQRGLETYRNLRRHYDQIRTQILSTILRTTPGGYRVDDARFLLGELHWRRDQHADARKVWGEMRVDPQGRYAEASASVLQALRESDARRRAMPQPQPRPIAQKGRPAPDPDQVNHLIELREINAILEAEYQRWLSFSRTRLGQFGYTLDSF